MRIKRYHLVSASDPESLQNEVSKLIAEGWQPYGQLVVTNSSDPGHARYVQAVVQYEGEIRS